MAQEVYGFSELFAPLTAHLVDVANPHTVTKTQVGLGNVSNVAQLPLSYLDTDGMLAANSDEKIASQKAVKNYADTYFVKLGGVSGGQTIYGDIATGGFLKLNSNTEKDGKIYFGANSVYDEANDRFGIGTTSPAHSIEAAVSGGVEQANITATTYGLTGGGIFHGQMANGTIDSPTKALAGNIIAGIGGRAYTDGGFQQSSPAAIHFVASEDQTTLAYHGSYLRFLTTAQGETTRYERVLITDNGTLWCHDNQVTYDPKITTQTKPVADIAILGSGYGSNGIGAIGSFGFNASGKAGFRGGIAYGTPAAPTATPANWLICYMGGHGYDGTQWTTGTKALLGFWAAEVFTTSNQGTYVTIETTSIGSTVRTEKLRITPDGKFGIGTTSPGATLDVYSTNATTAAWFSNSSTNTTIANLNGVAVNIQNRDNTNNNLSGILFRDSSNTTTSALISQTTSHTNHTGNLILATRPSGGDLIDRLTIYSTGNIYFNNKIGIGQTTALNSLHITGNETNFYGIRIDNLSNAGGNCGVKFYNLSANQNSGYIAGFYDTYVKMRVGAYVEASGLVEEHIRWGSRIIGLLVSTNPSNDIGIGGNSARTFGSERHTTSNTAGNNLTIIAGGATIGATNKNGGTLKLTGGRATGSGLVALELYGTNGVDNGATSDVTPSVMLKIENNKIGFFGGAVAAQQTLAAYTTDSESSAYTTTGAGDDIASKADLNTLRTAYDNLRASYDDLRTKFVATTLVAAVA